ncbi:hypothetical protein [Brevibacillus choshinensis]|uniref:hypothetical protein n=1 Tax=Brevibacillus choshinensis TaxID=54911 RepID=UPI002E1F5BB8|nr:hypothetical protein [Brevibacillus choshinensis]MED4750837.1 hypothetical protein [Brevibacillus choshinensis]MED4784867.1 hypothetical protein [Brevibacillus choshinensis]
MKRWKSFRFWLVVVSMLICVNNYLGNDDANILLIGLNPLLNAICYTEPFRHWIFDFDSARFATDSAVISVRLPAYILHVGSFFLIGVLLDRMVWRWKLRQHLDR